jgi:hypothetical protein
MIQVYPYPVIHEVFGVNRKSQGGRMKMKRIFLAVVDPALGRAAKGPLPKRGQVRRAVNTYSR